MERPTPTEVDVVGGAGASAWRIRYGTVVLFHAVTTVVNLPAARAYFAHGPWLRLLDTSTGTVIGRWRFPNMIDSVTPTGTGTIVDVRLKLPPWAATPMLTVRFDPVVGKPPDWDVGALLSYRVAEFEALELLKALSATQDPWAQAVRNPADCIAVLQDLVTRDPGAPLLRLAFAKVLRDAGDPRADDAFADISRVASTDYTEWFATASILERLPTPEPKFARDAFERALGAFIRRDRDPRLVDTLIARLVLFPTGNLPAASEAHRQTYLERAYTLAPTSEATERAWAFHAEALARQGNDEAAAVWRERAATSMRESLRLATLDTQLRHDRYQLLAMGTLLAALLLIVSFQVKYAAQRRMHSAVALRNQEPLFSTFLGAGYWSRRDRWSLLAIVVIGWLAMGHAWTFARVIFRSSSLPVHVGSISDLQDFTKAYAASPERDLIYALALQYVDKFDDAERLYRSVPQFAESWNNLGVMLARVGKTDESRQAFGRALEVDPALPEAQLNLRGEANSPATRTFQKYAPDMKMIAVPARERLLRGYLGPVWTARYPRILLGPLAAFSFGRNVSLSPALFGLTIIGGAALGVLLIFSIVILAFVRHRDVTVPPGRVAVWLQWIVPGIAPAWRWAGVPVLVAWSTVLLAAFFQVWVSTPYFLMAISQAGILRAFGYSSAYFDLNPPMSLLIGVPIVLWVANVAVIRYASRAVRE